MKKISLCLLMYGAICCSHSSLALSAETSDRTLDKIIRLSWTDPNLLIWALQRPGHSNIVEDYSRMFSDKLLVALATAEKKTVKATCDGQYVEHQQCGLDFNPLACSQQITDGYSYKIIDRTGSSATIEYQSDNHLIATYKVLYKKDHWVLDQIDCTLGDKFNTDH